MDFFPEVVILNLSEVVRIFVYFFIRAIYEALRRHCDPTVVGAVVSFVVNVVDMLLGVLGLITRTPQSCLPSLLRGSTLLIWLI